MNTLSLTEVLRFPVTHKVKVKITHPNGEKTEEEIQFSHLRPESKDDALSIGHSWLDFAGPDFRLEDEFGAPRGRMR